jgi:TetR/AcrR family transcriptional regulator, acrAB operon repressor
MVRKTKEEALQTRDRILDAAEQVFHAQGVAASSLQQVAEAASVTRGAVYHHFQDKTEIIEAMLSRVILPLEADSAQTLSKPEAPDPLGRIVAHVHKLFAYIVHTPRARRVFDILTTRFEFGAEQEPLRQRKQASRCEFRDQLAANLVAAQRHGELAPGLVPAELAIGLLALIDGLIRSWILEPGSFDLERVGTACVQRHLHGLRA